MTVTMKRRTFLGGMVIVAGVAMVPAMAPPIASSVDPVYLTDAWIYDERIGVWKNPGASARLRRRAAFRGGRRWQLQASAVPQARCYTDASGMWRVKRSPEIVEFGRTFETIRGAQDAWWLDRALRDLTWLNRQGRSWYTLPELRMAIPHDLGRAQMIAWYGVARA